MSRRKSPKESSVADAERNRRVLANDVIRHVGETLRSWRRTYPDGDQEGGGIGEAMRNILEHIEWSRLDQRELDAVIVAAIFAQGAEALAAIQAASSKERALLAEALAQPEDA